jgi:hypothetical protein
MHKGHPSDARLCSQFGKRAHLALSLMGAAAQRRISQADVMRAVESYTSEAVSDATVSRWFSGKFMPSEPATMLAVARALQVDPGWLYFGDYSHAEGPGLDTVSSLIATQKRGR